MYPRCFCRVWSGWRANGSDEVLAAGHRSLDGMTLVDEKSLVKTSKVKPEKKAIWSDVDERNERCLLRGSWQ